MKKRGIARTNNPIARLIAPASLAAALIATSLASGEDFVLSGPNHYEGEYTIASGDTLTVQNDPSDEAASLLVGYGEGGMGNLAINGGLILDMSNGVTNKFVVGDAGGTGTATMNETGSITFNTSTTYGRFWIGYGNGSDGTFIQNGGIVKTGTGSSFSVGRETGTSGYTLSGESQFLHNGSSATIIGDGLGGDGLLEIQDSAQYHQGAVGSHTGQFTLGKDGGTGKVIQSATNTVVSIVTENPIRLGYTQGGKPSGAEGTYQLDGGSLTLGSTTGYESIQIGGSEGTKGHFIQSGGTANFNMGGGELRVKGSAFSSSLGVTLTNETISTVNTNELSASLSGVISGSGSLKKNGKDTLTLSGNNSCLRFIG